MIPRACGDLAARLQIDEEATAEAWRRGLLTFVRHRGKSCWRFGDNRNGCFRRMDGQAFQIGRGTAKAVSESRGDKWHWLSGLQDIVENRREDVVLVEGSKDALAALHFAAAEGTLESIGVAVALGSAVKLCAADIETLRGRRVRVVADVDRSGQKAAERLASQLAEVATEVQVLDLADLRCGNGSMVKDLYDLTKIDLKDLQASQEFPPITDLDCKAPRVQVIACTGNVSFSLPSPPPASPAPPASLVSLVSPVSEAFLSDRLLDIATKNRCDAQHTARKRRWQLVRDLAAVASTLGRRLHPDEVAEASGKWHSLSLPYLDPQKSRDYYFSAIFAELGKVRLPTGQGSTLEDALARLASLPQSEWPTLPNMTDPPQSWRALAALHRELHLSSTSGTHFLTCRDAAKAHHALNKDSAYNANLALASLGVLDVVRIGDAQPSGGKATEYRYLLDGGDTRHDRSPRARAPKIFNNGSSGHISVEISRTTAGGKP